MIHYVQAGVLVNSAFFPSGANVFTWSLWQILWTEFQAQPNERYEYDLSTDTSKSNFG